MCVDRVVKEQIPKGDQNNSIVKPYWRLNHKCVVFPCLLYFSSMQFIKCSGLWVFPLTENDGQKSKQATETTEHLLYESTTYTNKQIYCTGKHDTFFLR